MLKRAFAAGLFGAIAAVGIKKLYDDGTLQRLGDDINEGVRKLSERGRELGDRIAQAPDRLVTEGPAPTPKPRKKTAAKTTTAKAKTPARKPARKKAAAKTAASAAPDASVSRPAPPHPWPVDPKALA